MQLMVIALFPSAEDASLGLDNLSEAEFGPSALSLVMRTGREVDALANASGPLNKLPPEQLPDRLRRLGLREGDARGYLDGVLKGEVFIAVSTPPGSESAAQEILAGANARDVRLVSSR